MKDNWDKDCPLCQLTGCKYYLVICKSCRTPMIVSADHKRSFSKLEKAELKWMFPNRKIRFKMRTYPDHCHCHIEEVII